MCCNTLFVDPGGWYPTGLYTFLLKLGKGFQMGFLLVIS